VLRCLIAVGPFGSTATQGSRRSTTILPEAMLGMSVDHQIKTASVICGDASSYGVEKSWDAIAA